MKTHTILVAALLMIPTNQTDSKPPLLPRDVVAALASELSGETAKSNLEFIAGQHRMRASRGYRAAAEYIADQLSMPLSAVCRIATFYNAFSLEPRGKHLITICLGTACHVKGAERVTQAFESELGIGRGTTTQDMEFTLESVRCIGCCGLAPVLKVGEDIHGHFAKNKVQELLKSYESL